MQNFCWYCLKCVIFSLLLYLILFSFLFFGRSSSSSFVFRLLSVYALQKKLCYCCVVPNEFQHKTHRVAGSKYSVPVIELYMHLTFNAILELGCHKAGLLYNTIIIHWLNKWKNTQYIDKSVYGYRIIRIQFQFSTHTWTGTDGVRHSLADMYGHNQVAVQAASACIIVVC